MQRLQPSNPNPSSSDHYAQLYNAQQSSSYVHQYPYYPHQTHNPTLVDTSILPPGINTYAAINSYPPTHVGLEGQATVNYGHHVAQLGELPAPAYYQDSGSAVQNWASKESIRQFGVDHVGYAAALNSLNKESEVPTSSTPTVWNNWNHLLANDATKIFLTKTDVMQTIWCGVCKIECNSKDVYARHILGKKHERNLKKQGELRIDSNVPNTTIMQSNPGITEIGNLPDKVDNPLSGKMIMGNNASAFAEDLESKRRKLMEGGAAFDSTRVCTICNVACNSQVALNYHLAGKRHSIKTLVAANPNPLGSSKPKTHPVVKGGTWKKGPKKIKIVQSAWCEICRIDCNSKDVLDNHKLGKKHKKNLEKLEESKAEAKHPMIGPKENPAADKGKTVSKNKGAPSLGPGEDLETKRRKLMEGGAAADAVRVCTVCNVVCNSQTVLTYHLSGQKHVNMVKKQAETAAGKVNRLGPGVGTAA